MRRLLPAPRVAINTARRRVVEVVAPQPLMYRWRRQQRSIRTDRAGAALATLCSTSYDVIQRLLVATLSGLPAPPSVVILIFTRVKGILLPGGWGSIGPAFHSH